MSLWMGGWLRCTCSATTSPGNCCRWSWGFGSGQTCWRRLARWQQAGVFNRLHRILLAELNAAGELD
ncbi:hypothetical protein ACFCXK_31265 [Streptomyces sp. NPDC056269]|uniref:hypothetical protein n=1 Tax=Streptomyces sp. NPDC056269 TaxID=3345768 RepID=UPI0035E15013